MLTMQKVQFTAVEVESEPGDGTHYSYYAALQGIEIFSWANNSEFPFPRKISILEFSGNVDYSYPPNTAAIADARAIASRSDCNVMTALECLRTAQALLKNEGA